MEPPAIPHPLYRVSILGTEAQAPRRGILENDGIGGLQNILSNLQIEGPDILRALTNFTRR